jgi:hypothetical protein
VTDLGLQVGSVRKASVAFRAGDGSASSAKSGSVVWSTSDAAVLSVTADPDSPDDELRAQIEALAPGTAIASVSGNANLGTGDARPVTTAQSFIVS